MKTITAVLCVVLGVVHTLRAADPFSLTPIDADEQHTPRAADPFSLTPIHAPEQLTLCAAEPLALTYADEQEPTSGPSEEGESSEAEKGGSSQADLAQKLQNPVADLISVPFQYNADFNIGPKRVTGQLLKVQPVIPVHITQDWNLIIRTILSVIHIESVARGVDSKCGIGDIEQSFFFSPKEKLGGWILGAGPVFLYPSGSDGLSGRKWGVGPTAVALRQECGWTYGILANHIWSFAGSDNTANVNKTFLQPFITYTFKTHTTIVLNTESTYDWVDDQWTVPINLDVEQLLKIGSLPVQFEVGPRYYAESPTDGPEWGVRFAITLLFPD